jgi:hypothetical protein
MVSKVDVTEVGVPIIRIVVGVIDGFIATIVAVETHVQT